MQREATDLTINAILLDRLVDEIENAEEQLRADPPNTAEVRNTLDVALWCAYSLQENPCMADGRAF